MREASKEYWIENWNSQMSGLGASLILIVNEEGSLAELSIKYRSKKSSTANLGIGESPIKTISELHLKREIKQNITRK